MNRVLKRFAKVVINYLVIMLTLVFCTQGFAQNLVTHVSLPTPSGVEIKPDSELKNLIWNKFQTDNFAILSLNVQQGQYLKDNIEKMKTWVLTRWGLPDSKLSFECKVIGVPSKELMKKLFGLDESYAEIIKDDQGKIKEAVIWVVLDGKPAQTITPALTTVCAAELGLPLWASRGMYILNSTIPQIKQSISPLAQYVQKDNLVFLSESILNMDEEKFRQVKKEERELFDRECAAFCLLLRKEFGQSNFINFLRSHGSAKSLAEIYRFKDYEKLDGVFLKYMTNLSSDINNNKTPDSYLDIKPIAK